MKKLSLITTLFSAVLLSACGDKKIEEVETVDAVEVLQVVKEVKKETYNKITDAKKFIDKANDAAKLIEDAANKQQQELKELDAL